MDITWTELLTQAIGLLTLYNPPLAAMTYAPLTGHLPADVRRRISLRMVVWISVVFAVAAWGGQAVLKALGLSAAALSMTGALMLMVFAVPMALGRTAEALAPDRPSESGADWHRLVAIPLIFPLSIGGGMVALVIATAARAQSVAGLLLISLVGVALATVAGITHYLAGSLARRMNADHLEICKRIGGLLLVAIAIQMLADSSKALLPGLAGVRGHAPVVSDALMASRAPTTPHIAAASIPR